MADRRFVISAPFSLVHQAHEGCVGLGSKLRSLVQNPVVVAGWNEVARIQKGGEFEISRSSGIAEPQHVDLTRPRGDPAHDLLVDLDEFSDVGKGLAELVEKLSEVGPRLAFVGVRPQLERES